MSRMSTLASLANVDCREALSPADRSPPLHRTNWPKNGLNPGVFLRLSETLPPASRYTQPPQIPAVSREYLHV